MEAGGRGWRDATGIPIPVLGLYPNMNTDNILDKLFF